MSYSTTTFTSTNVTASEVAEAFGDVGGSDIKFTEYYDQMPGAGAADKGLAEMFGNAVIVLVTGNENNFNLFTAAGSPSAEKSVLCIIESGVTVNSTSPGTPGFNMGSGWHASTVIQLQNNGDIKGRGGGGGRGAQLKDGTQVNGNPGVDGGDSISMSLDLIIDNTNGNIYGGGGGGGGGGAGSNQCNYGVAGTAGGGGGGGGINLGTAGPKGDSTTNFNSQYCGTQPTAGAAGTASAVGARGTRGNIASNQCGVPDKCAFSCTGGHGGAGGSWGVAGVNGVNASGNYINSNGGAGGSGGKAVAKNGNTLTWLGGNNPTQVKGAQT